MVEEFSEFDKSHLAVLSSHFYYLSPESLAERMGGEVPNVFQHILYLDFFQDNIDPLNRDYITIAVEEAILVRVFDAKSLITLLDMLLHTGIDLYLTMLTSFLLVEGKALTEYLFPRKGEEIAYSQPEETATSDKKAHPISTILEQSVCQVEHCVPRKIIGSCV